MMVNIKSTIIALSIIVLSVYFFLPQTGSGDYTISLVNAPAINKWDEIPGRYPIIAITNKERWPYVEQLSGKINRDFKDEFKGVFLIDYSGQDLDFFSSISAKDRVWLLDGFDGSHYALYPFTKIPAYYFIDEQYMAQGPFYKRSELLRAVLAADR